MIINVNELNSLSKLSNAQIGMENEMQLFNTVI